MFKEKGNVMKLRRYADKFVLVSTYAEMSEEERKRDTGDETPIEMLAVDEAFLTQHAKSLGYGTLDRFLAYYLYDTLIGFRNAAEKAGALAFAFSPSLGKRYYLPKKMTEEMAKALMEFAAEY